MMKGFKLLVMSQERDLRVTVDSWLGMLDIWDVWAKRPIKYILRKKPGQEIASALFRVYLYIKNPSASAHCTLHPIGSSRKTAEQDMFKERMTKMTTGNFVNIRTDRQGLHSSIHRWTGKRGGRIKIFEIKGRMRGETDISFQTLDLRQPLKE